MNITEKISRLVPGITVAETGDQVVTVPVESFRQVAEALRNDKDEPMDFLRDIVIGVDDFPFDHFGFHQGRPVEQKAAA